MLAGFRPSGTTGGGYRVNSGRGEQQQCGKNSGSGAATTNTHFNDPFAEIKQRFAVGGASRPISSPTRLENLIYPALLWALHNRRENRTPTVAGQGYRSRTLSLPSMPGSGTVRFHLHRHSGHRH
jgi:hypothetical protein